MKNRLMIAFFAIVLVVFTGPLEFWREEALFGVVTGELLDRAIKIVIYVITMVIVLVGRDKLFSSLKQTIPLLLLLGWAAASVMWSGQVTQTTYLVGVIFATTLVGWAFAWFPDKKNVLYTTLYSLIVINVFALLFMPEVSIEARYNIGAWRGIYGDKNTFGMVSCIMGLFFFSRLFKEKNIFLVFSFALSLVFLIASGSRSAMAAFSAALLIALIVAVIRHLEPNRLIIGGAALGTGLIAVMAFLFLTRWGGIYYGLDDLLTLTGRVGIWAQIGERIIERPLLGYGYNSFWRGADVYPSAGIITRRGVPTVTAHNGFIDITSELGLIGLLLWIGVLGQGIQRAWQALDDWFPLLFIVAFCVLNLAWSLTLESNYLWILFVSLYVDHPIHPATAQTSDEDTIAPKTHSQ